jgi:O-antigen/teichoic acid export membrane protein
MTRLQQLDLKGKVRAARADPLLVNSSLIFITTAMMAGGGAVFWVIAARLQSPENVGLAGSLVSAGDSIALFAQLGLNITLMRTMPSSSRKAADVAFASVVVAVAGGLLALGYSLLLPITSPRLTEVLGSPGAIALYSLFVAGTALNILTDSIFLSINQVMTYLKLNGILLGVAKVGLPFVLTGAGAFGLYTSFGGATAICGLASAYILFRFVPGKRLQRPSPQLLDAKRFAGAGYVTYVLNVVPQLVIPLLIINALGPARGAVFFISVQIVTLQNAIIFAVGNSMYAESEKKPDQRRALVRRGGFTMAIFSAAGVVGMVVLAPYFLRIFGSHYSDTGTATLRVLSLSTFALAFNYWSAMRLRLARHLSAMILVQLLCTSLILGLSAVAAPHGTIWVAVAWAVGQLVGGVVGYVVSVTIAPIRDEDPIPDEVLDPAQDPR